MRRLLAGLFASGALFAGLVVGAPAAYAQEDPQPIREPMVGACIRPVIGEGGVLNLPGIDIPGKRIPNDSIELTIGGQYRDCKMGGIGV